MLSGEQITAAALTDWRKLGQGLHARFVIGDFRAGVRFLAATGGPVTPPGIISRYGWARLIPT
jgi:hypothetical protein